jgi:hypothetical protein
MVIVKVFMTLQIDDEEYTMPADGRVDEELEDAIQEMMYDIDGIRVRTIRTVMENRYE